jgi:hypothetical protein
VPSDNQAPSRIQFRLFDSNPTLVPDFGVTMNDCGTAQLRVQWRALGGAVVAGISFFTDAGQPVTIDQQTTGKRQSGSMWLSTCEQPVFIGPGGIDDVVVETAVFVPAMGAPQATLPATVPSQPQCSKPNVMDVIRRSGAVAEGASFTIPELACDSGWAWGAISNPDFGGAVFILTATGDRWTLVDLGSAICPTREGMPPAVAARIVPPGEADCG